MAQESDTVCTVPACSGREAIASDAAASEEPLFNSCDSPTVHSLLKQPFSDSAPISAQIVSERTDDLAYPRIIAGS
jgi:hypothetical protein